MGTTWEREIERSKNRFLSAKTQTDVYYALLSLQRSLHDAHSTLGVPDNLIPPSTTYSLPFTLAVRGNSPANAHYVVVESRVPALKVGSVLKQYQNRTVEQLEYDLIEWSNHSSPELLKLELANELTVHRASHKYPPPDPDVPVTLRFADPDNGTDITITVQWLRDGPDEPRDDYARYVLDYQALNYRIFKDSTHQTLILVYSSFNYQFRDAELKKALTKVSYPVPPIDNVAPLDQQNDWGRRFLEANDHPNVQGVGVYPFTAILKEIEILNLRRYLNRQTFGNLLIDVRANQGGSYDPSLLALFATQPFRISTRTLAYVPLMRKDQRFFEEALAMADPKMRPIITDQWTRDPGAAQSPRFPFFCKTTTCSIAEVDYSPDMSVKKFNVAVLSGPNCVSACDQFVSGMHDNGISKVLGLPSRGGDAPFRAHKELAFKNGQKFAIGFSTGLGFRPNGQVLEGHPAEVEYYLYPEEDYLDKMIRYLSSSSGKQAETTRGGD